MGGAGFACPRSPLPPSDRRLAKSEPPPPPPPPEKRNPERPFYRLPPKPSCHRQLRPLKKKKRGGGKKNPRAPVWVVSANQAAQDSQPRFRARAAWSGRPQPKPDPESGGGAGGTARPAREAAAEAPAHIVRGGVSGAGSPGVPHPGQGPWLSGGPAPRCPWLLGRPGPFRRRATLPPSLPPAPRASVFLWLSPSGGCRRPSGCPSRRRRRRGTGTSGS